MADFPGGNIGGESTVLAFGFTGRVPEAYQAAPQPLYDGTTVKVNSIGALTVPPTFADTFHDDGSPPTPARASFPGKPVDTLTPAIDWFEDFHVLPRSISLGNVLSAQNVPLEVYSAYRESYKSWNSFVNNAGVGLSLVVQPPLPYTFAPQTGLKMNVVVSPSGPPKVDTTLDFGFDIGTIFVPITFDRVVLFPIIPEAPYTELLEFLVDVIEHKDGSEQRISCRQFARQLFQWELVLDEGAEYTRINNVIFDWQGRIFGLPMLHEETSLTIAATVDATTVTVMSTDNADYRISKLVVVYKDQTIYDVLELASLTSTTLTFGSPLLNNYPVGSIVAPLRTAYMDPTMTGDVYPVGASRKRVSFIVEDNEVDLASTAGFPTFNGKVLLSDFNGVNGSMQDSLERSVVLIDSKTGKLSQASDWDRSKRSSAKTFLINSQAGLWTVRKLMHAFRGRQVSFYLPTFWKDLTPTAPLGLGSNQLQIQHVGYTQFVRQRQPRNAIQVLLTNGTTIERVITGSSVLDANNETITLNANWASAIPINQIVRISFIEKVRMNSDTIRFDYNRGSRTVKVSAPVKAVFE